MFVLDKGVGLDFMSWAYEIGRSSDADTLGLFFALCWGVWFSRNSAIFNNVDRSAVSTVQMVCVLLRDFGQAQSIMHGLQEDCGMEGWSPLEGGFVKVKFDGATFKTQQSCGVGVLIRDQHREPITALSEQIPTWMAADCIEAIAAVKALEFAAELGLTNIHLEGDSLTVVKAI
ncbi:uncharacterized protein LOC114302187 [Camellia sinensis]|uniref:uncharacterized protein LOC114302187 n=1 Tax=Camellia sinensis TaxID=4442 RepID=UPI00103579EE|nr:uncharacterized protein LOC114302187 [Camellia sinensis]